MRYALWNNIAILLRSLLCAASGSFVLIGLVLLGRWAFVQLRSVTLVRTAYTTPPIEPDDVAPFMRRIIISDTHLGCGDRLEDFTADDDLAAFVMHYVLTGEPTELILAGDTFEFLQVRLPGLDDDDWSETAAVRRFEAILAAHPKVMQALRCFVAWPANQLTVLIGNHDFELHYPAVKRLLREALQLAYDDSRLRFGISYHGGGIYLVHGNQFDSWNRFVHFEGISEPFEVVRGTQMVKEIINDLEEEPLAIAPLIDNVKPSSAFFWYMVALPRLRQPESRRFVMRGLLRFFQIMAWPPPHRMPITGRGPGGMLSAPPLGGIWRWVAAQRRQRVARQREVARQVSAIADTVITPDQMLIQMESEAHRQLKREIKEFNDKFTREMLMLARSAEYGANRVFVCGHTHLARVTPLGNEQLYINTGTWVEIIYDITTMQRQEQRCPFVEVTYTHDGSPQARLLVWRGASEAPQPWHDGPVRARRRRVRIRPLRMPALITRLRPRGRRRLRRGNRFIFARRRKQ